jgi:hypothetical protein
MPAVAGEARIDIFRVATSKPGGKRPRTCPAVLLVPQLERPHNACGAESLMPYGSRIGASGLRAMPLNSQDPLRDRAGY